MDWPWLIIAVVALASAGILIYGYREANRRSWGDHPGKVLPSEPWPHPPKIHTNTQKENDNG